MALGWSKSRPSPIAVDFGADSLKMLQVLPGPARKHTLGDPPQLIAAASVQVPEDARSKPTDRYAFFAEAVKELLTAQPFKGKRAILAIPAYQTLVQHLQIARVDREDFEAQIGLYLRQRLNIDPSRMVIRHYDVGTVVREGSSKQEILCMAASREAVMRHIEIAHRSKLDVVGMHCEPQCVVKAFEYHYRREADKQRVTCFVDIGAATTKVVIAHGSEMVFAKVIHAAGDHFSRQVAKSMDVSLAEARVARINAASQAGEGPKADAAEGADIAQPVAEEPATLSSPEAATAGGVALAKAPAKSVRVTDAVPTTADPAGDESDRKPVNLRSPTSISEPLDCLIDELRLCVRYYQTIFPDRAIEKVIFLGGESSHLAVCQKIARDLRLGAQLGDPLARLVKTRQANADGGVDLEQSQPGWAVPMGLCLSDANL